MPPAASRLRPLLRVNDWQALDVDQQVQVRQRALAALDGRIALGERELQACYARLDSAAAGSVNAGAHVLASRDAAAWLHNLRTLRAQRAIELRALEELQVRRSELKHKRSVIERRREEIAREHAGSLNNRLAAEQDDQWLNRRPA